VERLSEPWRVGPATRALRKVQQLELGAVEEVKKEVEREADYETAFEEIKELLCEGSEVEREGSAVAESSSDGYDELDVASLPSLQ